MENDKNSIKKRKRQKFYTLADLATPESRRRAGWPANWEPVYRCPQSPLRTKNSTKLSEAAIKNILDNQTDSE